MKKPILIVTSLLFASSTLLAQDLTVDQLIEKGIQQHDKGEYGTAVTYFRKAIDIDSNSDRALYEMANTLINIGKYDQAADYATKTIRKNKGYLDQAYTLKGTALDLMKKPYEALEVYLEGLKKFPDDNLLRYNTALTYLNQKKYSDAEFHAAKAAEADPTHASSHYLLGYAMYLQGKRIQSILSLDYFLVLENNTKRSVTALQLLQEQMASGASQDGNNIKISVSTPNDEADFNAAELTLSMSQALKLEHKDKSEPEQFYDQTKMLHSVMAELKDDKKSHNIWWDMYVPFFKKINDKELTEAMCYYISASKGDASISKWLDTNKQKTNKLLEVLPQNK